MTSGVEPHPFNGQMFQQLRETAAAVTGQPLRPLEPPNLDQMFGFLNTRRDQLLAILRKSIELNEPLRCSL